MKLSMNWLSDFTDVSDVAIKDYCDRMTDTGSKVEGYEIPDEYLTGVVCGRILSVEKHPDAERLVVCSVDVGADSPLQIVTAATNVYSGALVPVATDGSHLAGDIKIKKGKLRGVVSEGMFCSIEELGLTLHDMPGAIEDGILILGDCGIDAPVGTDIRDALMMRDSVVEFEITPNRPDCLSVIGLARESAVSYGRELNIPVPEVKAAADGDDVTKYIKVDIASPTLCPRYTARAVKNVRIAPSPLWLRMRLRAAGVRPINNIVDITNYVMLEYGQPMHAFDYSCLDGSHIIVRTAVDGENFKSLDDKDHVLTSSNLVIADEKKAVALAGVMGGANSEITDNTKTVIFESANFLGSSIRTTARSQGMRTESSSRYEKGMDAENTMPAVQRACELVQLLDAGDVVDGVIDVYPGKKDVTTLTIDPEEINTFLGCDIDADFMRNTLLSLGFGVEGDTVTVPSYRADVECMNDLAEEVIRIYGYNSIESAPLAGYHAGGRTPRQAFRVSLADALCGMDFDEICTFSFISPKAYDKIRMATDDARRRSVTIMNPLGEDTSVMRTTALPSMLSVISGNYSVKNHDIRLFEPATVYLPSEEEGALPAEPVSLVLGMCSAAYKGEAGFYRMKGYVDAILAYAGVTGEYEAVESESSYHPGRCAAVTVNGERVALMGEIHPEVLENYGIGMDTFAAEIDFEKLFSLVDSARRYAPLPKFPALERDLSLVCAEEVTAGSIEKCIASAGGNSVSSVKLFDIYRGPQIGDGKKSVSFAVTLRAADRTLTDDEADGIIAKIMKKVSAAFGAELRS